MSVEKSRGILIYHCAIFVCRRRGFLTIVAKDTAKDKIRKHCSINSVSIYIPHT